MFVIGLTGGLAAGKSTVARLLGERGAAVIDADRLGHRAYARGQPAFAKVVAAFGEGVVAADGEIDRRALGGKVFGDAAERKRLTDIVWPEIRALARAELALARAAGRPVAVLEAAVLLEAGWRDEVDEVWAVTVPPRVAVARATARDGVDEAAARARIDAQLTNVEREAAAQVVIDNTGPRERLAELLDEHWRRVRSLAL